MAGVTDGSGVQATTRRRALRKLATFMAGSPLLAPLLILRRKRRSRMRPAARADPVSLVDRAHRVSQGGREGAGVATGAT